jgi:hypothetical protein
MKKAAVGFRVHSGWSAMVVLSLHHGAPIVLRRRRAQLVETFSYTFRQPYHTAEKMDLAEATGFITRVRKESEQLAHKALRELQTEVGQEGYHLDRGSLLLAAGRPLPELEKILKAHALIHTADGELFRETLRKASKRCGMRLTCVREKELLQHCSKAFSVKEPTLLRRVTELGKGIGPPWSQDEKFATLAAWLTLGTPQARRRTV